MAELRNKKENHVLPCTFLDEEKGVDVELLPIPKSTMVLFAGFNKTGEGKDNKGDIYLQYRDCVWRYDANKDLFNEIFQKVELGESVGKFVDSKIKPLPGAKVGILE